MGTMRGGGFPPVVALLLFTVGWAQEFKIGLWQRNVVKANLSIYNVTAMRYTGNFTFTVLVDTGDQQGRLENFMAAERSPQSAFDLGARDPVSFAVRKGDEKPDVVVAYGSAETSSPNELRFFPNSTGSGFSIILPLSGQPGFKVGTVALQPDGRLVAVWEWMEKPTLGAEGLKTLHFYSFNSTSAHLLFSVPTQPGGFVEVYENVSAALPPGGVFDARNKSVYYAHIAGHQLFTVSLAADGSRASLTNRSYTKEDEIITDIAISQDGGFLALAQGKSALVLKAVNEGFEPVTVVSTYLPQLDPFGVPVSSLCWSNGDRYLVIGLLANGFLVRSIL